MINLNMNIEARIGQSALDHGTGNQSARNTANEDPARMRRVVRKRKLIGRWQIPINTAPMATNQPAFSGPKTIATLPNERMQKNGSRMGRGRRWWIRKPPNARTAILTNALLSI